MKKILVACEQQFDVALDKSVAHLKKSCLVEVSHDSDAAFDEISRQTFDLIIVDFQLPGSASSLELIESIPYIDPDVAVILLLGPEDQAGWPNNRHLKAYPIERPFKPIRFLRVVDKLLHKQLVRYRQLAKTLETKLELLCTHTGAVYAFLVENSGQILVSSREISSQLIEPLGNLAVGCTAFDEKLRQLLVRETAIQTYLQAPNNYGLHVVPVIENLFLGLLVPVFSELGENDTFWEAVETTILDTIVAFHGSNGGGIRTEQPNHQLQSETVLALSADRSFIPFELDTDAAVEQPIKAGADDTSNFINWQILSPGPGEETQNPPVDSEEAPINWDFMSNAALLDRLGTYCRIG